MKIKSDVSVTIIGYFSSAARWLFTLAVPVILISGGIALAFNSLFLYQSGFEKYEISRVTGLAPSELNKAASGLIAYFNSGEPEIDITVNKDGRDFPLFNDREIIHLRDVKGLVWLDYRVLIAAFTYAVAYAIAVLFRGNRRRLASGIIAGSALTLALMLLVGVASVLDFDSLFLQFHLISFTNDLWQLDPSRDYLVMMFPEEFWYDTALFCLGAAAAGALALGGIAWAYRRLSR